jgi:hypothetical protein
MTSKCIPLPVEKGFRNSVSHDETELNRLKGIMWTSGSSLSASKLLPLSCLKFLPCTIRHSD